MDRPALLALWSELMGSAPPRSMSQPLLRRILAWEVQAKVQGGLPAAVRAKLDSLSAAQAKGTTRSPTPKLKPGGRFLREWNGVTHVVDVVEGGFLWRGERHRSLSAVARAITGAHWSGPRFFGLQEAVAGRGARGANATTATTTAATATGAKAGRSLSTCSLAARSRRAA
jgi:hypothetical protein